MPVTAVTTVPHGRPATEALAAAVARAQAGDPFRRVTVVVASNLAGLSARRILGGGQLGLRGLANVAFLTPFAVAEQLAAGHTDGRRPLTNAVLAAAIRAQLAEAPGWFHRVAGHHATELALLRAHAELSACSEATLAALAGTGPRGAGVVAFHRAVCRRLAAYHDEAALAAAAAHRLAADPHAAQAVGAVVWHLPEPLSPPLARLVAAALQAAPCEVVVGRTGVAEADAGPMAALAAAGVACTDPPAEVDPPVAEHLVSVSDPDEEVRAAVRQVVAWAEQGVPLDRMAVLYPQAEPYLRTLLEQLDGAGVPHNGPSGASLAHTVAGRTVLGLLDLPGADWGRAAVLALAATAPVRHDGRPAAPARWEVASREAGVVAGAASWAPKLASLATALRQRAAAIRDDPDRSERQARALEARAADADALAGFVAELQRLAAAIAAARTWAAAATALQQAAATLLAPANRRSWWPDHELAAADRVEEALSRLAVLDGTAPPPNPASFVRAVRAELDVPAGRRGRFGHGLLIGPLASAPGLDLDAVVVLGLAEGTCPTTRADDPLLPDADRAAATGAPDRLELRDRAHRRAGDHRAFLAALQAAPPRRRMLLHPRGDLRTSRTRLPSRWLLESAAALAGRPVPSSHFAALAPHVVRSVASYAAGVAGAPSPADLLDRDLAQLLAHRHAGGDPASHPAAAGSVARGIAARRARRSDRLTEWDGNLTGQPVPSPTGTGQVQSASRLQTYATCGYRYFLAHVLWIAERDDPERITEVSPLDKGSIVHAVLERFLLWALHERPGGPPAPDEPWTGADHARLDELAAHVFADHEALGRTGRPLLWEVTRQGLQADLHEFLRADDAHRAAHGVTPAGAEIPFGMDGAPAVTLELPDGRRLHFRGRADRLDRGPAKLVVADYKTGKPDSYTKLSEDPVRAGTVLQLGLYAEALSAIHGHEASGDRPAVHAAFRMVSARGKYASFGYDWTDDRRRRFLQVLGTIADGIEAGVFDARPGSYDPFFRSHEQCSFCPYDRVCPRDRDDHEQRKAGAPELGVLAGLKPAGEAP